MRKQKRFIAAALCVVAVLVMTVSAAYIVHEAGHGHDCTGEDCPVCALIAQVVQTQRWLGLALALAVALGFVLAAARFALTLPRTALSAECTLVSWKIRLND